MAYKEASVNATVARLDARMARVEALLVQLVGSPAQAEASAPTADAAQATTKVKVGCTLHPEQSYTLTPAGDVKGSGFHFGWCKGTIIA